MRQLKHSPLIIFVVGIATACSPPGGHATDAGAAEDSGGHPDSGNESDAGEESDAGNRSDAGTVADAGCSGRLTASPEMFPVMDYSFSSICAGSWGAPQTTAVAYELQGGMAGSSPQMIIDGCTSNAAMSQGITLTLEDANGTGSFTKGTVTYIDSAGLTWTTGNGFLVDVNVFPGPGGLVDGSYNVTVNNGTASQTILGGFNACRVADEGTP